MNVNEQWIAGFLEGDGYIRRGQPEITLSQQNLEPLIQCQQFLNAGTLREQKRETPLYDLILGASASRELLSSIYPLLSKKRRSAADTWFTGFKPSLAERNMDWFSGFYEAEGGIFTKTNGTTTKRYPFVSITQYYDTETLDTCKNLLGVGTVKGPKKAAHSDKMVAFFYDVHGKKSYKVVDLIYDNLSKKKKQQIDNVKSICVKYKESHE